MSGPALLRAVIEHPDDDARRLVYADWLQQQGDPQGELIAIQIQLAHATANERAELETRARALLDAHAETWTAALGDGISHVTFQRGLAYAARAAVRSIMNVDGQSHRLLDLLDRAPIRDLGFVAHDRDDDDDEPSSRLAVARDLAADPRLARVELLATGLHWGADGLAALLGSPHLGNLRGLQIADPDCRAYAGEAIAAARLPRLELLALRGDWQGEMGDAGVGALARAELPALRDLALLNLDCGEAAARALASSTTLTQLQGLDFGWGSYNPNRIGPSGAAALAESANFAQLRRLILDFNGIGDDGLTALARSPHLGAMQYLSLKSASITDAGVRALAEGPAMPALELLELTFNRDLTHVGIEALAGSARLATLTSLWLRQTSIGPDGARALARSPHTTALRSLNLLDCKLGDEGAQALLDSPHLDGLTELQLSGNKLSDDMRSALHARWGAAVRADR
ncbi:MAG: TIGR02996 domain-containing protein [Deltaproteobacteria bacterium]